MIVLLYLIFFKKHSIISYFAIIFKFIYQNKRSYM